jgi:hypothetical protein
MIPTDTEQLSAALVARADSVRPHAPALEAITDRSRRRRRRHRRRSAVVAGVVSAMAVVAAAGLSARHPGPEPATVDAAGSTTTSPSPPGPPLRIGLAAPAEVTSATDRPSAQPTPLPKGVAIDFADPDGTRRLSVLSWVGGSGQGGAAQRAWLDPRPVDLGDGRHAVESDVPSQPDGGPAQEVLDLEVDGISISISATGLSETELQAVARTVRPNPDASFSVPAVPADLRPGPSRSPFAGDVDGQLQPIRSQITYRLPDGSDAVIDVYDGGASQQLEDDLARARAQSTPERSLTTVRGNAAVVRRFPELGGDVTVTWAEPTGHVVSARFTPTSPATVLDVDALLTGIRELTEPEFQALVAQHPGG